VTLQEKELVGILKQIIEHVERDRPRGFHIYPTQLRDKANSILRGQGIKLKPYNDCLKNSDFDRYK